jgi:hypothetical protein
MERPKHDEYADYYHTYISKVPDGDIVRVLDDQRSELVSFLSAIPEERGGFRYADGKWSLKEVVGHVVDVERVFGVRALAFARRDPAPLPSMEQDDYVAAAGFDRRSLADLGAEFDALRRSHVILLRSFDGDTWLRAGTASDCTFTVRAVAWILAGHARHHADVIQERYL